MTEQEIEAVLTRELFRIAPDIEVAEIDRKADLREEFDIDSMDFLNLVTALSTALRIDVPETDYAALSSYDALCAYLKERA